MRALLMSEPAVVDSLEFARTGQQLNGTVAVSDLRRLTDSLFDDHGTLEYAITGKLDSRGRPQLRIEVRGEIHLRCERCLRSLPYRVDAALDLLVLTGDGAATDALEDLDGVPADPHPSVVGLVEDEVLLALPMTPRHPEGQCGAAARAEDARSGSPFAVLAQLKHD